MFSLQDLWAFTSAIFVLKLLDLKPSGVRLQGGRGRVQWGREMLPGDGLVFPSPFHL